MYYRLVNIKTKRSMQLSFNSQDINEVREDLLLYISLEHDEALFTDKTLEDLLVHSNIKLESSEYPFEVESPIAEYLVKPIEVKPAYKPVGRIAHVSNYMH